MSKPFHHEGWVYEEKYDGWRMLVYKHGRRVRLVSRLGRLVGKNEEAPYVGGHSLRWPKLKRQDARDQMAVARRHRSPT